MADISEATANSIRTEHQISQETSPERIRDSCDEIVLLVPEALNGKPKKVIEKKLVEYMDETI